MATERIMMNLVRNETDSGEDESTDGVLTAKIIAMVVLSLATFLLGFIPIILARCFKWNQTSDYNVERTPKSRIFLSILLAFGGGALLCTTFMHLLPEINEKVMHLQEDELIPATAFSLSHLIMCCGFFMMYFIEELVHLYLHSREHAKQKKTKDIDQVLHRSFSMRQCSTTQSDVKSANSESSIDTKEDVVYDNIGYSHQDENSIHIDHSHQNGEHHGHIDHSHQDGGKNGGDSKQKHSHQHNGTNEKGHSHVMISNNDGNDVVTSFRGLLIVVALSVHELFEGLAVGLETTSGGVYYMFGAVSSHKLVLAFCVGLELVSARTRMSLNVVYLATFALVSPAGIGIGIGLSEADSSGNGVLNVVLQGIASGTLLYVVFFEVLTRQRVNTKSNGLLQLLAIMVGFGLMFGLLIAAGHDHDDDEHGH